MFFIIILVQIFFIIFVTLYFFRPSFSIQKERLLNLYSSVLSDMNIDLKNADIGTKNIMDISISIDNLSKEIEKISKQKMSEDEKKWLVHLIEEFRRELSLWIARHSDELKQWEESIAHIDTDIPAGKHALELAEKRLEVQREALAQIR